MFIKTEKHMRFFRTSILFTLLSAAIVLSTCADSGPEGTSSPKFHTEESAGIWVDKIDSHLPVIRKLDNERIEVRVNFSPTLNPLHYVETIILMKGENTQVSKKRFQPSTSIPVAVFKLKDADVNYWVVSKCNLHDMWRVDIK